MSTKDTRSMTKDAKETRGRVSRRQPYVRPTLREFGPVGTLTQGGTGMNDEGMMATNLMRQMV